jgi:site-specific DNA-methyltransferase (adenine-specific)/adenine-specific DNA-methyltransferase
VFEQFAYADTWVAELDGKVVKGTIAYLLYMYPRLCLLRELLSEKGSIYVHCDWHIGHYLKIILDEIFGKENFINEIVWCYKSGGAGKKTYAKKHDTLYFYGKTDNYIFNPDKEKSYFSGARPGFKNIDIYKDDEGNWYSLVNMKDWWDLNMVGRSSDERIGYGTQKPEKLLERVIKASSNEDSIVLDCFCGSGTTLAVAEKLKRKWIGCDIGKPAILTTRKRLVDLAAKNFAVLPFEYLNIGYYAKEIYEQSKFKKIGDLAKAILDLYDGGCEYLEGSNYDIGRLKKDIEILVYVESPNKHVGKNTIDNCLKLRANFKGKEFKKILVLGWSFTADVMNYIKDKNKDLIELKIIPQDLLNKLQNKGMEELKGHIRFNSLQYLTIKTPCIVNNELQISLDNYFLCEKAEELNIKDEEDKKILEDIINNSPLNLIEYWSLDLDYNKDLGFKSVWQTYRGVREDYKISLDCKIPIEKLGKKRVIAVKAVDIFGLESIATVEIDY